MTYRKNIVNIISKLGFMLKM